MGPEPPKIFTAKDAWAGGHFGLVIDLAPEHLERMASAFVALWDRPSLRCYMDSDVEPSEQEEASPSEAAKTLCFGDEIPSIERRYGTAVMPNGVTVACLSYGSVYGPGSEEYEGWGRMGLDLPMGSLAQAYPVGAYPFVDGTPLQWRSEVSEWLREIGDDVFHKVGFARASIGHESGYDLPEISEKGVPEERWDGYLIPAGDKLEWYPPNMGAPFEIERSAFLQRHRSLWLAKGKLMKLVRFVRARLGLRRHPEM